MSDEMKMSVSGVVKNKAGEKTIYVTFEDGYRKAEGSLPSCRITGSTGFSKEEVEALERYMDRQRDVINGMAKEINPMKAFLSDGKNTHPL